MKLLLVWKKIVLLVVVIYLRYGNFPVQEIILNELTSWMWPFLGDCPANLSQFYEVLLLGKIKVSHKVMQ